MIEISEFKNRELRFISKEDGLRARHGHQVTNSKNYEELQKIIKIYDKPYNSYVSIATYIQIPRLPLFKKERSKLFNEWHDIADETAISVDFFLDFDGEPTIEGITKAWEDTQKALKLLEIILGEQGKYLKNKVFFSGNKGFCILAKTKITETIEYHLAQHKIIAEKIKMVCPTIDLVVFDTKRIRKLIGSYVYSKNFGKTRVVPICNDTEFKELLEALKTKDIKWFEEKPLVRLDYIKIPKQTND